MTESHKIYYLDFYYPTRYENRNESSKKILELKRNEEQAIAFWYNQLKRLIDIDCGITIVPSHTQSNNNNASGISSVAKKLIKNNPNYTDLTSSLNRHTTIKKLSGGGDRHIDTHLNSIEIINKNLINSQSILLLDDVTTSGNSLLACKELLEEAGAKKVICLAFTKTVGRSSNFFIQINRNNFYLSNIFSSNKTASETYNFYLQKGEELIEEKKFKESIIFLTKAIKLSPNDTDGYILRGFANYEQANANDNFIDYLLTKDNSGGFANYQKAQLENAIEDYTKAIKLSPNDTDGYILHLRGFAYEKQEKFENAIEDYTKAIKLSPNDTDGYIYRGCANYRKAQFENAIEDYTKAIKLSPNNSKSYIYRGCAYEKQKKFENAIKDFTQVTRLDPNNFKIYENIACIYKDQSYFRKASENFLKAPIYSQQQAINNESQKFVEEIAKSYKRRNIHIKHINLDQAFNYYNELINVNCKNAEAYFVRGLVQFWQEKFELALDDLNRYMYLKPELTEDAETYFRQGVIFLIKTDFRKAINSFQKCLDFNTDFSEVYFLLGLANFNFYKNSEFIDYIYGTGHHSKIEQIDEAINNFDQSLIFNKNNDAETYFLRGCVYKFKGNFERAIYDLNQSIYFNPENSEYYHTLGDIFYEQEKHKEALAQYNKALTIDAINPYLYQSIGKIYKKENNIKKAVIYFQKASNIFLDKCQEEIGWYRSQDMKNYKQTIELINQLISELTLVNSHFIFRTSEEPNFIEKDSSAQVPSYNNEKRRRKRRRSSSIQKNLID